MPEGFTRIYSFRPPGGMPPDSFARLTRIGCVIFILLGISFMLQGIGSLFESAFHFLVLVPIILISLTFHEFAHAKMADFLGDPTPDRMGRLSLNPLRHLDFFGTLLLFFTNFGWAKPVIVDPSNFRVPQRAMLSVALAGPAANLTLALAGVIGMKLLAELIKVTMMPPIAVFLLITMLKSLVLINLSLALFNLLPVPPLDGSRVVAYFLPGRYRAQYRQFEEIAPMLLLLLFALGGLSFILNPSINFIYTSLSAWFGNPLQEITLYLHTFTAPGIQY
ncbi:MAG TPA: site-2 protease family protein [Candidatus Rifleibacterium sp.]|nr:site-2 protease family protein [Candidatus Rifleibacterium sp.]HPT48133.1 site-2 protease family protein [Candidatus Rifleibacterium sp.]